MEFKNYLYLLRQTRRFLKEYLQDLTEAYRVNNFSDINFIEEKIARCFVMEEKLEAKIASFEEVKP